MSKCREGSKKSGCFVPLSSFPRKKSPFWRSDRDPAGSKKVLQSKLHGTGAMGIHRMQECAACQTTCIPGRIIASTVATDCVATSVAEVWIVDTELSVVENVEGFDSELQVAAFTDPEMFQQCDIEIQSARVVHKIAPGISKGQTSWSRESGGIA